MLFNDFREATQYASDEFHKWLNNYTDYVQDAIILIKQKYDYEKKYDYLHVPMMWDNELGEFCWEYDWNEGQRDVTVIGIIGMDDIKHFDYIPDREEYQKFLDIINKEDTDAK